MTTSILQALINIKSYGDNDLSKIKVITNVGQPRINKNGDPLDAYMKDSLCKSFGITNPSLKKSAYLKDLSHLGSQNNPPDIIIRNSDAVEVKKVGSLSSPEIQLNSSHPKSKLHSNDPLIKRECRECEKGWDVKDMAYAIGCVIENKIKSLLIIYGDCFCADAQFYLDLKSKISAEIDSLNFPFSKTRELGRLNNVDPLKSTSLRIRGMWIIKNPHLTFSSILNPDPTNGMNVFAIMRKGKFDSFDDKEKNSVTSSMNVSDIKIKDPDNPKKNIDAKLISFNL